MKPILTITSDRRSFLSKGLITLVGAGACGVTPRKAQAAFGPSCVPTTMSIAMTPTARLSQRLYVNAMLRRLDGGSAGLAGVQAQFWVGNPTYPTINLGRYVADGAGAFNFTFLAVALKVTGEYVIVADLSYYTNTEGWIAAPRPFARFTITR